MRHSSFFLLLYIGIFVSMKVFAEHSTNGHGSNEWKTNRVFGIEKNQEGPLPLNRKASLHIKASHRFDVATKKTSVALLTSGGGSFFPFRPKSPQESSAVEESSKPSTSDQISSATNNNLSDIISHLKTITKLSLILATIAFAWECRHAILIFFRSISNTETIKSNVLSTLEKLQSHGDIEAIVFYTLFLMVWELIGVSTIPLETAAGMVFGIKKGLLASSIGRLGGAMLAYALGRVCFAQYVKTNVISNNEVLTLVEKSMSSKPFKSSLVLKYCPLPETVKNFALSVMPPVKPWIFAAATFVHGFPFSVLWSNIGWDSALRLKATERIKIDASSGGGGSEVTISSSLPPNKVLGGAVIFVTAFAIVGSPTIMALWINALRKEHIDEHRTEKGVKNAEMR